MALKKKPVFPWDSPADHTKVFQLDPLIGRIVDGPGELDFIQSLFRGNRVTFTLKTGDGMGRLDRIDCCVVVFFGSPFPGRETSITLSDTHIGFVVVGQRREAGSWFQRYEASYNPKSRQGIFNKVIPVDAQ